MSKLILKLSGYNLLSIACAMSLSFVVGCKSEVTTDPEFYCILVVTSVENPEGHEMDPQMVTVGGGDIGGEISILINGQSVKKLQQGGTLFTINEWISAGENEIQLVGQHQVTLYAKVMLARRIQFDMTGEMKRILAYLELPAAETDGKIVFEWKPE